MRALVRGIARSFAAAETMEPAAAGHGILLEAARAQHEAYVRLLRSLVRSVTEVPADDKHPGKRAAHGGALCCSFVDAAADRS